MHADDWQVVRCVRLAALADAPDAFERTLEEEVQRPDSFWQERLASHAEGESTVGYLALRGDVGCGMAVGLWRPETRKVDLVALWVVENVRRHGVARSLTQAICSWARERGAAEVTLEVTLENQAAIGLYRSLGFEVTGEPLGACGTRRAPSLRMRKAL